MDEFRLLPGYLAAVLRHGWLLGFALIGALGNIATVIGEWNIPRWIWWAVIAVGVLGAQFRAYCDVLGDLATVQARLRELDTVEARRAFIELCLDDARSLREDARTQLIDTTYETGDDHDFVWDRICTDLIHWETDVRRALREFPERRDLLFDSEEGLLREGERQGETNTGEQMVRYMERREERLRQIRGELG